MGRRCDEMRIDDGAKIIGRREAAARRSVRHRRIHRQDDGVFHASGKLDGVGKFQRRRPPAPTMVKPAQLGVGEIDLAPLLAR